MGEKVEIRVMASQNLGLKFLAISDTFSAQLQSFLQLHLTFTAVLITNQRQIVN